MLHPDMVGICCDEFLPRVGAKTTISFSEFKVVTVPENYTYSNLKEKFSERFVGASDCWV